MTDNGSVMAAGTVLCILSAVCLMVTVKHYRQKGAVFSAAYFAASREDRAKLRTKKAYWYAAHVFLYLTLVSGCFGGAFLLGSGAMALTGVILAAGGALSAIIYIFTDGKD